ncbi:hypothetical protein ABFT23_20490 [Nocardioides sp. C4-1]|uniref:hypothetical protein n=1 Tax=Nocardioides sp. C4-1 TaxID=3151851 RepID=UPI00326498F3
MSDDQPQDASSGSDPRKRFREMEISEEEQREIAEERERRLDPANRPPNSEVDNTDRLAQDDGAQEERVGSSDPRKRFREMEISEEEQREIAEERERRLDPANRPPNSEVDNTHRTFDGERFVD